MASVLTAPVSSVPPPQNASFWSPNPHGSSRHSKAAPFPAPHDALSLTHGKRMPFSAPCRLPTRVLQTPRVTTSRKSRQLQSPAMDSPRTAGRMSTLDRRRVIGARSQRGGESMSQSQGEERPSVSIPPPSRKRYRRAEQVRPEGRVRQLHGPFALPPPACLPSTLSAGGIPLAPPAPFLSPSACRFSSVEA